MPLGKLRRFSYFFSPELLISEVFHGSEGATSLVKFESVGGFRGWGLGDSPARMKLY